MVLNKLLCIGYIFEHFVVVFVVVFGNDYVDGFGFEDAVHAYKRGTDFGNTVEAFFGDFGDEVSYLGVFSGEPFHDCIEGLEVACFFMWPLRAI